MARYGDKLRDKAVRCDCCGQSLKYACIVEHKPTAAFYNVGRQCAAKIQCLSRWSGLVENASVAMAERAACNAREKSVLAAASDDFKSAYAWAGTAPEAPALAKDIRTKVRTYGDPSTAQQALLVKVWSEDIARRAAATGTAPTGKQTVTGTVLSVKVQGNPPAGRWGGWTYVAKVLVDLGNGAKVYGNAPGDCIVKDSDMVLAGGNVARVKTTVAKGQKVSFTANFEPSQKDPLFGFWKRPAKWMAV